MRAYNSCIVYKARQNINPKRQNPQLVEVESNEGMKLEPKLPKTDTAQD